MEVLCGISSNARREDSASERLAVTTTGTDG